jgi:glucose-6-phosphate isomerase, archaeal
MIKNSPVSLNIQSGQLTGTSILHSVKKIKDLVNVFQDQDAYKLMDPEETVYEVEAFMPEKEGTPGGLYFGNSTIYPGKVGHEYFMTRGHFHANLDTAEYYWCLSGEGVLIFMDIKKRIQAEKMIPGSLHYIPRNVAHRVANTGKEKLVFNACWPSNAGHDYSTINENGFSARLLELSGKPRLVPV